MKTICKPTITIHVEQDDIRVRGNAVASGDPDFDKKVEDEILARLDKGDVWAWASVEVRAEFRGLVHSSYLGACCYESEEDFKTGGYYEDMVREAVGGLADKVAALQEVEIERIG